MGCNIPESAKLWQFLSPRYEDEFELTLDGRCPVGFVDELESLRFQCNVYNKITALFVHKSFFRSLRDAQQHRIFENLCYLEDLSLFSTRVSAKALVKLISQTDSLKCLRLDRITLSCDATDALEVAANFCQSLSSHSSLKDFHMSIGSVSGALGYEGGGSLFAGEDANVDTLVSALASIKTLETAYIGRDGHLHRNSMRPDVFASMTSSLKSLTLANVALSPYHFESMRSNSTLRSLNLIQANLGDAGAEALAQCICRGTLNSLQKVYVPGNGISDVGGIAIVHAIHRNEVVRCTLEVLDLHDNLMTSSTGAAISELLVIHGCRLAFLDMSCNMGFGDEGGVAVASALYKNGSLEQLVLIHCGVGDDTCKAFASSLRQNRKLTKLNLYDNEAIGEHGIVALAESLEHEALHVERLEIKTSHLVKFHDIRRIGTRTTTREVDNYMAGRLMFFLRLNREFKRRDALMIMSEKDFVENVVARATAQQDLDALYYFLCSRPALLSSSVATLSRPVVKNTKITFPVAFLPATTKRYSVKVAKTFCNPQA